MIQAELFAELDQLLLKNPIDEMKRGLSTSRQKLTEGLHAYGHVDVLGLNKAAEDQAWLQNTVHKEARLLSEQLLNSKFLSLFSLEFVILSLTNFIEDVLENSRRKEELGFKQS